MNGQKEVKQIALIKTGCTIDGIKPRFGDFEDWFIQSMSPSSGPIYTVNPAAGEILPAVDFSKNIVVFTRNVQFYNRTSIFKVELQDGAAEIFAMETMSAMPIEEKVAMAMAVIPREGIRFIRSGTGNIKVMDFK